jgi:predicted N-acyltransferase
LENPDFRYAIEHFLGQEETAVQEYIAEAQSQLPFKQAASD